MAILATETALGNELDDESLAEALGRFWKQNIQAQFPDRSKSILSESMVSLLAERRPESEAQWYEAIPIGLRQSMDAKERGFLDDILDLIAEDA